MKILTSTFVLALVLASSAQAKVIAQLKTGGGLLSPGLCGMHKINIDDSGLVTAQSCEASKATKIAKLSRSATAKLVARIDGLEISPLGSAPRIGCVDAPSTYFSVAQKNSSIKTIAANVNCMELEMQTSNYEANNVRDLLQGFLSLAEF